MASDEQSNRPSEDSAPNEGQKPQRSSLENGEERPSSECLGRETAEDSTKTTANPDEKLAVSLELDEKASELPYFSKEEKEGVDEDDEEEQEDDGEILPKSPTEDWEEKVRFSKVETLKDEEKRPRSAATASSNSSRCSHRGHGGSDSSVTLANSSEPKSPTTVKRNLSLQRPTSLRITPRVQPTSPSAAAASEQRAFPLSVQSVGSHNNPDIQTVTHASFREGGAFSEPHSETPSIISSMFASPLRHLASHSSLHGSFSLGSPGNRGRLVTPVAEQRHPGKAGVRISRFTRPFEPDIDEDDEENYLRQVRRLEALKAQQRMSQSSPTDVPSEKMEPIEGWPLVFLVMGICLVVFLISVDRTILTTAIPYITAEFRSTADIGWYGSAYLLTACAFQPVFGRVFMLFSVKWSYILSMFVFLIGSLICGVAPSSFVLIIGRAVAGLGSAGILTGSFVVIATAVPLRLRPIYTAVVGLMFGFGATIGPLLGGAFTDLVTWRWCFYMNLPIAGATVAIFLLFFHPKRPACVRQKFFDRVLDLDLVGNVLLLGACVMLFLALEYTTQGQAWSSAMIIGLLVGAGMTFLVFTAWQWWKQDGALLPPAIITQRTVAASCVAAFTTYGALLIHAYFLPIWFQAIRGEQAISSGVDMIPYVATNAFFSLLSGVFVSVVGYFMPPAVVGSVIGTAGCGVLRLLSPDTSTSQWVGFEILVSAGFGMSIQQGFTAVQAVLPPDEISIGTAAVVASQSLGGAIFVSVGNTLFQNHLQQAAAQNSVPGVDLGVVLAAGATAFRTAVPESALPVLLDVYNEALRVAFTAAIPLAGVAAIATCFMEWKSVKGKKAA